MSPYLGAVVNVCGNCKSMYSLEWLLLFFEQVMTSAYVCIVRHGEIWRQYSPAQATFATQFPGYFRNQTICIPHKTTSQHLQRHTTYCSRIDLPSKMSVYFKNLDMPKICKKRRKVSSQISMNSFPSKLYRMLQDVAETGRDDIVCWAPDGLSFQVHDVEHFVKDVLSLYFNQSKYKSFQRQLNFYGFTRVLEGPLEGSYRHQRFIRGHEAMCRTITRHSISQVPLQLGAQFKDAPTVSPEHARAVITISEDAFPEPTPLPVRQQSIMSFNVAAAMSADTDDDLSAIFDDSFTSRKYFGWRFQGFLCRKEILLCWQWGRSLWNWNCWSMSLRKSDWFETKNRRV